MNFITAILAYFVRPTTTADVMADFSRTKERLLKVADECLDRADKKSVAYGDVIEAAEKEADDLLAKMLEVHVKADEDKVRINEAWEAENNERARALKAANRISALLED